MLIKNYLLTSCFYVGSDYMKVCSVKFKDSGKSYYFKYEDDLKLNKNVTVVVDTEKGEQFAKVSDPIVSDYKTFDINKMKSVIRISTKKDYSTYMRNTKDAHEALIFAREVADKNKLEMRFVDASFTLDRKQLTFNFVADERVDFRNIVKEIAAKFKTRIELHQMGVRDNSKEIGGIGMCGRQLCCSSFLSGMETISINMAKNQGLSLNPTKINGCCGRLLCCLSYEDEVYSCHRQDLPKMNSMIKTPDGEGKVVSLDVLNKKYTVDIKGERHEYEVE